MCTRLPHKNENATGCHINYIIVLYIVYIQICFVSAIAMCFGKQDENVHGQIADAHIESCVRAFPWGPKWHACILDTFFFVCLDVKRIKKIIKLFEKWFLCKKKSLNLFNYEFMLFHFHANSNTIWPIQKYYKMHKKSFVSRKIKIYGNTNCSLKTH